MTTTEHPTLARARAAARGLGSRAQTTRGLVRALLWSPEALAAAPGGVAPTPTPRSVQEDRAVDRASDAARGRATAIDGAWGPCEAIAWSLGLVRPTTGEPRGDLVRREVRLAAARVPYGDTVPVVILGGRLARRPPALRGSTYWFRWLGAWKQAPGSYQQSTRRVECGWDVAATLAARLLDDA